MRLRETVLVAAREGREALRSRWFPLSAASFLVLSLGLSLVGLAGSMRSGLAGFDRTTASLLNLALLFIPLMTLTTGGLSIAGELEDGSLSMLLSQPLTRGEAYLGKYLGLLLSVWAAILTGFGATGIIVGLTAGGGDVMAFLSLTALSMLLSAATLAAGTFLSAALRSRARAIGGAFAVWLFAVYLSDMGTIGLTVARGLSAGQVFAAALLNPVQQARLLGVLSLSHRLDLLGPAGLYGLDHFGPSGLPLLLAATLLVSALLPLLFGWAAFRRAVVP